MLLILAARPSIAQDQEESFTSIEENEPAPFTGFLFRPAALAKIYADIEQQERTKQLQFDTKLAEVSLELAKVRDLHRVELEGKDLILERITTEKNKRIADLTGQVEGQKWFTAGAFIAGVLLTGSVFYFISTAGK